MHNAATLVHAYVNADVGAGIRQYFNYRVRMQKLKIERGVKELLEKSRIGLITPGICEERIAELKKEQLTARAQVESIIDYGRQLTKNDLVQIYKKYHATSAKRDFLLTEMYPGGEHFNIRVCDGDGKPLDSFNLDFNAPLCGTVIKHLTQYCNKLIVARAFEFDSGDKIDLHYGLSPIKHSILNALAKNLNCPTGTVLKVLFYDFFHRLQDDILRAQLYWAAYDSWTQLSVEEHETLDSEDWIAAELARIYVSEDDLDY